MLEAIIAFKSGWIRISNVDYSEGSHGIDKEFAKKNKHKAEGGSVRIKNLNGWVFAKKLGTNIRNYDPRKSEWLTKNPSQNSEKIISFDELSPIVTILECKNSWLKVKYKNKNGWLAPKLNCPSSLTTCP